MSHSPPPPFPPPCVVASRWRNLKICRKPYGMWCWFINQVMGSFQIMGKSSNLSLNWGKRWQHIHPNEEFGWICWIYIIWSFQIMGQSSNLRLNLGKRWQHIHPNEEWMDYWCFPFIKQTKKQTNKKTPIQKKKNKKNDKQITNESRIYLHVLKNQCDVFW